MSKIKKIAKAIKEPLEKIQKKIDAKYGEGSSEFAESAVVLSAAGTGTVLANKKRKEAKKKYTPSNREAKKGFGIEKK
jgi:hypothetical protein